MAIAPLDIIHVQRFCEEGKEKYDDNNPRQMIYKKLSLVLTENFCIGKKMAANIHNLIAEKTDEELEDPGYLQTIFDIITHARSECNHCLTMGCTARKYDTRRIG